MKSSGEARNCCCIPKTFLNYISPQESNTNTVEQVVINNVTESIIEVATKHHETGEIPPEMRIDNDNNSVAGLSSRSLLVTNKTRSRQ